MFTQNSGLKNQGSLVFYLQDSRFHKVGFNHPTVPFLSPLPPTHPWNQGAPISLGIGERERHYYMDNLRGG